MSENIKTEKIIKNYDYKEVTVPKRTEGMWIDSMEHFGWSLTKKEAAVVKRSWGPVSLVLQPLSIFGGLFKDLVSDHPSNTETTLTFKRDRKIVNKTELVRLQLQYESTADQILQMENSKKTGAAILSTSIALVGTACMGGAVFSYIGEFMPGMVLAVPGFLGWIIPYFAYQWKHKKRTEKIAPLIEQKQEELYAVTEKAASLVYI